MTSVDSLRSIATPKVSPANPTSIPLSDESPSQTANSGDGSDLTDAPPIPKPVASRDAAGASVGLLFDPILNMLASSVDDFECLRKAQNNRYRMLTGTAADGDGIRRSLGLSENDPEVMLVRQSIEGLEGLEDDAIRRLQRHMRRSAWGPWLKQTAGVGEKQLARFLATVNGDPYWNGKYSRPRTLRELYAYCGMHTIVADVTQSASKIHTSTSGGGDSTSGLAQGGHEVSDSLRASALRHTKGSEYRIAPSRRRGVQSNWNPDSRMRIYLIATSAMKTNRPTRLRVVYDEARQKYEGAAHRAQCAQCGPAGKPAQPGSPLSPAHAHARALRAIAKTVLRDLWEVGRDHYQKQAP